jgi:hypothetical protein
MPGRKESCVSEERGRKLGRLESLRAGSAEAFAADLKRRGQAAKGLERDLLTKVPILYGSPGSLEPHGDPGIVLAKIHQEELQRRNGGGLFGSSRAEDDVRLPFERAMGWLCVLYFLWMFFAG